MKRKSLFVMLLLLCLCGCGNEEGIDRASGNAVVDGENTDAAMSTEQASTEIRICMDGEIHYTEVELQIVKNALGDEEGSKKIMEQLNQFGIYNITRTEVLKEEEILVETSAGKRYVLHVTSRNYYIYAIQKDGEDGEYIYMELND